MLQLKCSAKTTSYMSAVYPLEMEDRFKIGRIIGDGNFAIVHECVDRYDFELLKLNMVKVFIHSGKRVIS